MCIRIPPNAYLNAISWVHLKSTVSEFEGENPMNLHFFLSYYFYFWLHYVACRILVSQPSIELWPPAVEALSPNHWTTRECLGPTFFKFSFKFYLFIFGCAGSLLWGLFSSCSKQGLLSSGVQAPYHGGSSRWGAWAPELVGLSNCSMSPAAVAPGLQSTGSTVLVHKPSLSAARGILPDQGSNPRLLQW